jgi:dUTPase
MAAITFKSAQNPNGGFQIFNQQPPEVQDWTDLSPASRVVLTPEMGTQAVPTGIYGPLPAGSVGLLLGRGGMTMKGLHVFPGVIDSNFQGEIKVVACTLSSIVTLTPEQKLVELILIPYLLGSDRVLTNQPRGKKRVWVLQ